MGAALKLQSLSVADYLAGELISTVRHEYLGGAVYAMAGGSNVHNTVAGNILAAFHQRLRGHRCRPFNSHTKVRVKLPSHLRFFYPDAMVVCRSNPPEETFQDEPAIVVEVISPATRRVDEGEKREAYQTIPSLEAYLIVETGEPRITVWRRGEQGFTAEVYAGPEALIEFPFPGISLPLADVYEAAEYESVNDEEGQRMP